MHILSPLNLFSDAFASSYNVNLFSKFIPVRTNIFSSFVMFAFLISLNAKISEVLFHFSILCRAFSDLLGKFLVPMKLGKKCVILGKNMTILGKNSTIFSKIGKVYLLNWDFSANLGMF